MKPFRLIVWMILVWGLLVPPSGQASQPRAGQGGDASRFVFQYATALANENAEAWAMADLGCLSRDESLSPGSRRARLSPESVRRCWDDTLKAHRDMVAQQTGSGGSSAVGRGVGFGLLHNRHRSTENWKEYPPAVFLSPAIVRQEGGPVPAVTVVHASPIQSIALAGLAGSEAVTVRGQAVDVKVVYTDPLSAPLALRPEEIWWVNGAQRRFGPVREVIARFVLVSGLRKYGFPVDQAVLNEALSGAPRIPTTYYGLRPDAGRRFDHPDPDHRLIKGELIPGSARWWERTDVEPLVRETLDRVVRLSHTERRPWLTKLLLLDPLHAETHALRGDDAYQVFLKQGMTKGRLAADEPEALERMSELYWSIQAQTWRQEMTAVSDEHEPAAEALYQALASYDTIGRQDRATSVQRRRLGALTRWNNDPTEAVLIHERLLKDVAPGTVEYGRVLAELAWDRLQWASWERRYDHPWLQQANREAEEAARLLQQPYDRLYAVYVQVAVESLLVPRNPERFHDRLRRVKQDLDSIPGVKGLPEQLLANDLVKALSPEAAAIVLPSSPRSPEVLDVAIHAKPPKQDIVWQWNFDQDRLGSVPSGFVGLNHPDGGTAGWEVTTDGESPSSARQIIRSAACAKPACVRLLVAESIRTTYPDVTVQIKASRDGGGGGTGVALAVRDADNYYSVTLQASTGIVTTRQVLNGTSTILGQVTARLAAGPWHTIRVQRINFLHLDKGRLAVYVDGAQVAAVEDVVLPQEGQVGMIALGSSEAYFDGLHVLDLVSNRTFSKPAAY
ncbi:MAG: hypothetical protein HP497_13275 [Nitrospira sp.]|nr:hypothetical protein [Nitrospira sp.]